MASPGPVPSDPGSPRIGVLFVCMGNICRSPLAEGVFRHHAAQRGVLERFHVDSAGTGAWHAGELADRRMRRTAARRGIELTSIARQVIPSDFERFHHILCADRVNLAELLALGAPVERTHLLLSFAPDASIEEVPDPYYGGDGGFERVYELVDRACAELLGVLLEDGK